MVGVVEGSFDGVMSATLRRVSRDRRGLSMFLSRYTSILESDVSEVKSVPVSTKRGIPSVF